LKGLPLLLVGLTTLAACGGASTGSSTTPSVTTPSATATGTPNPASDAYPIMASLDGHLAGPWTNATFKTTGTMTWDVTSDPTKRTVTLTITLTGNVLGGAAPAPERIELTHLATGIVQGPSASFGTVNGVITPDGRMHFQLTNLPETSVKSVDIAGKVTQGTSVEFAYTVTLTKT
jgi:hypothetical protein